MTNKEIAAKFNELADLLEIKGEANPFRILGIRKAARAVESLAEPITELRKRQDLSKLPDIGKGSIEKMEELLSRGSLQETERLLNEIPPGLLDMLKIPDVGPKTVQTLWKSLRINTISQLEEAVRRHELKKLKGFGEKKEQNILRGIELFRRGQGRFLLGFAYPIAEDFVSALQKVDGVEKIAFAGSLRRMKETVGDVDILVSASKPEPVMEAFVRMPQVRDVLAKGATKSSVRTALDLQIDLRVVPEESFGAALQYFTGSKEHNVALRGLAKERGWKINEYGVYDGKGRKMAGATEEEVYKILGLDFIPPELRENRGELQAAKNHTLPKLIEQKDLKGDFHIHTHYSDGKFSIDQMCRKALELGYTHIAITDHSKSLSVANGLDEKRLKQQMQEIKKLREKLKKHGLEVLCGMEMDILADGSLDLAEEVTKNLDFCIGSIHSRFKQDEKTMTERIIRAIRSGLIDCLGHPTGRQIGTREPLAVNLDKIIQAAVENDVALEMNAQYERLDLNDIHARHAREMGAKFFINSDAHHLDHFEMIRYGVATARRAWIEKERVFNTLHRDVFKEWLRRRRKSAKF